MSVRPDYYRCWVEARTYSGDVTSMNLECNDLAIALAKKNNLSIRQAWYYMLAIKYLFRLNNKGEPTYNIDKAITCLEELRYQMNKRLVE